MRKNEIIKENVRKKIQKIIIIYVLIIIYNNRVTFEISLSCHNIPWN